jgi:uncharacterized membrane protein YccC
MRRLPTRFWVEIGLALFSATLLALTLVMPDWLEVLFGLAPDAGDGSVEWGMAITLAIATLVLFGWAGRTWRRHARRPLRV